VLLAVQWTLNATTLSGKFASWLFGFETCPLNHPLRFAGRTGSAHARGRCGHRLSHHGRFPPEQLLSLRCPGAALRGRGQRIWLLRSGRSHRSAADAPQAPWSPGELFAKDDLLLLLCTPSQGSSGEGGEAWKPAASSVTLSIDAVGRALTAALPRALISGPPGTSTSKRPSLCGLPSSFLPPPDTLPCPQTEWK